MRWNKKNFFESRFSQVCSAEPEGNEPSSSGGGDFGGGGFDDTPAGGTVDVDAGHSFEPQSPQPDVGRATQILQQPDDTRISMSDIRSLLRLDLPKPPKAPAANQQQPQQAAPAQGQPPANPQQQTPPANSQQQQQQQPPANQADQVAQAIREGFQTFVQTQQQQPANQQAQPEAPKPYYGHFRPAVQISPQLKQALFGENVDEQTSGAMDTLVNGIMNQVVQDLMPMVVQLVQQRDQQIQQQIPQHVQQVQQTLSAQERFFGRYKELNRPAYHGIVDAIAARVKAEWKQAGKPIQFNDEYFDAIGTAVHNHLEQELGFRIPRAAAAPISAPPQQQQQRPQQVQQPQNQPPQGGRFWANGSARPPAGPVNVQSEDLRDFV